MIGQSPKHAQVLQARGPSVPERVGDGGPRQSRGGRPIQKKSRAAQRLTPKVGRRVRVQHEAPCPLLERPLQALIALGAVGSRESLGDPLLPAVILECIRGILAPIVREERADALAPA